MAFCHKTQRFHAKAASSGLPLLLSYNLLCKRNCLFSNGSAASCRHHYHLLPTKCYILICNMWLNARRKVTFRIVKDGLLHGTLFSVKIQEKANPLFAYIKKGVDFMKNCIRMVCVCIKILYICSRVIIGNR